MDVIVVVDMQIGLLSGPPKYDLVGVVDRINSLTAMVRSRSGTVIWVQHCGTDDDFAPHSPGWPFLPEMSRRSTDIVIQKTLNDPFVRTDLRATLEKFAPDRVLIAGWATDFCVDATVRSAVSNNYNVVIIGDGRTLSDRPHLDAPTVIRHHNWIWNNLITNRSIRVAPAARLLEEKRTRSSSHSVIVPPAPRPRRCRAESSERCPAGWRR
jgi:nicotinamidase-related amidase